MLLNVPNVSSLLLRHPIIALLAIHFCVTSTSSATSFFAAALHADTCQSLDAPNPMAQFYPNNVTGVLNGTLSILPIPLTLARSLIPSQYTILTAAYTHLLPNFPTTMYPALYQAVHDHDVHASGDSFPDFSRASLEFPFLDVFGDGTSFRWVPSMLISADNPLAINGTRPYGTEVYPASFDPPCDAYRSAPGPVGTTTYAAQSEDGAVAVETRFSRSEGCAYPLSFFVNSTNQASFGDARSCNQMLRFFNTSASSVIEEVRGSVRISGMAPLMGEKVWEGVEGIRLGTAFLENNYLPCENFKGYGDP